MSDHHLDFARQDRTGIGEAVLSQGKSADQLLSIANTILETRTRMLFTKLVPEKADVLAPLGTACVYDAKSHTAVVGIGSQPLLPQHEVVVVAAGTSDLQVAREAYQTLAFYGSEALLVADVGVAGLWRLMEKLDAIRKARVVIAVAGMEGALFSVLGGLVAAPVIAVPSSVGYGVALGGQSALSSALSTCSPGVVVVNIDNGFGAACAALKMLDVSRRS